MRHYDGPLSPVTSIVKEVSSSITIALMARQIRKNRIRSGINGASDATPSFYPRLEALSANTILNSYRMIMARIFADERSAESL